MTNQHHVTQHHTAISPASPVSILQNSPFYSPVKHSAQPTSPHSSTFSTPFMEQVIGNVCSDDQEDLDSIHQDDPQQITNDSDEGIESEDGEDIDGEAFKQLIRYQNIFKIAFKLKFYLFSSEKMFLKIKCTQSLH